MDVNKLWEKIGAVGEVIHYFIPIHSSDFRETCRKLGKKRIKVTDKYEEWFEDVEDFIKRFTHGTYDFGFHLFYRRLVAIDLFGLLIIEDEELNRYYREKFKKIRKIPPTIAI